MEIVSIVVTVAALIATVVFGHFQLVVPFIKKEVRWSRKFPFIESTEVPQKRRRKKKRSRWLIPVMAILVIIIVIVLTRVLLLQAADLPRKPIAIMQFKNLTGDEQYDYLCEAIPNLLITNLEQSDRLQVMTWERMHDLLKQLDKEELVIIDEETGFELCRMDDVNTIVIGSFTKAGDVFVTEVKILDVSSRKLLKTAHSKSAGVASILKIQVDDLSNNIARHASLFERTTAPTQMQIMEVTTSSMEAYNYFIRGRIEHDRFYYAEAARFLEKAVEIDSTFASAYYYLGIVYYYLGNFKNSDEAYRKAKALSGRVTEKERLYIEAEYAQMMEKNFKKWFRILDQITRKYPKEKYVHTLLAYYFYTVKNSSEKAIEEYKKALELDPNYGNAMNHLAYQYAYLGDYARAIEYLKRYAAASPGDANPFDSMGDIYFKMGNLDDALAQYKEVLFVKPNFDMAIGKIAYIHALREKYNETMKYLNNFIDAEPSSEIRAKIYCQKAYYDHLLGNSDHALTDLKTAENLCKQTKYEFGMIYIDGTRAWIHFDNGNLELSRACLKKCYANLPGPANTICYNFSLGLIELKQKSLDSAKTRLVAIESLLPDVKINMVKEYSQFLYDLLLAEMLLAQDSLEKLVTVFADPPKLVTEEPPSYIYCGDMPYNKDIIARAYYKKGDINRAIIEYERLTNSDPNKRERCLIHPLWHYDLAKLYEQKGLKHKAIEQYKKFLDLWKDADPDLPEPHDARKRLARLKT